MGKPLDTSGQQEVQTHVEPGGRSLPVKSRARSVSSRHRSCTVVGAQVIEGGFKYEVVWDDDLGKVYFVDGSLLEPESSGVKTDGGAAFPEIYTDFKDGPNGAKTLADTYSAGGMSLRDYFAARALPWCLGEFGGNADDQKQPVEAAYQIADLMLAEKEKSRG